MGDAKPEFAGYTDNLIFWRNYSDSIVGENELYADGDNSIVYPNPFTGDQFYFHPTNGFAHLEMYSITGQKINMSYTSPLSGTLIINVPGLAKGIYILIAGAGSELESFKVIKMK